MSGCVGMSGCVDHKQLYEDLHEVAPQWRTFGIHLGVPFDKLQGLQGEASTVERCFTEVLVTWLNEGGTVEQLISALKYPGVDQGRLSAEIRRNKETVKLELPYLLKKLDGCKATWFHFGIGLGLNDNNLRQIEKNQSNPGVLKCLHGTLRLWLNSEDPNLGTLVKAIELSGYGRLASSIKSKYQGKSLAPV